MASGSKIAWLVLALELAALALGPARSESAPLRSLDEILAASPAADWRAADPENTLLMSLPQGRVAIELAPAFAPNHVTNIKRLVRAHFYDGLAIVRLQDNYVVQWGDADAVRPTGEGHMRLAPEFDRPIDPAAAFTALPDPDTYAPVTGFADGFPAARDPGQGRTWLTHCYGMVGAGRDVAVDTGGGPELYAVIGQAPRQLDRNVTLVGQVIAGMEVLAALPRGHGPLGFYQTQAERTPILRIEVAADAPPSRRPALQILRTDSATFAALVDNRRFRREPWFNSAAGHIDVCNLVVPTRVVWPPAGGSGL